MFRTIDDIKFREKEVLVTFWNTKNKEIHSFKTHMPINRQDLVDEIINADVATGEKVVFFRVNINKYIVARSAIILEKEDFEIDLVDTYIEASKEVYEKLEEMHFEELGANPFRKWIRLHPQVKGYSTFRHNDSDVQFHDEVELINNKFEYKQGA